MCEQPDLTAQLDQPDLMVLLALLALQAILVQPDLMEPLEPLA